MYYFTSESVSPGHPDKLCDHLSDAILDHVLSQDKESRVACETFVKGKSDDAGTVVVGGEITTQAKLDIDELISCLLYTSPSPRDMRRSRMPSSA